MVFYCHTLGKVFGHSKEEIINTEPFSVLNDEHGEKVAKLES